MHAFFLSCSCRDEAKQEEGNEEVPLSGPTCTHQEQLAFHVIERSRCRHHHDWQRNSPKSTKGLKADGFGYTNDVAARSEIIRTQKNIVPQFLGANFSRAVITPGRLISEG
jgi:hypothetical protein